MDNLAQRWQAAQIEYKEKIRTAAHNSAYVSNEHEVEDMEQELLIVLWETCAKYNPDRGMTFNSFFWLLAKQRIGMLSDRSKAVMRTADLVSLDAAMFTAELEHIEASTPQPSAESEAIMRMDAAQMARRGGVGRQWKEQIEKYNTA